VNGAPTLVRRIVLRLDPGRAADAHLDAAARLASALHAELAARLVADTRIEAALAFADLSQGARRESQSAHNVETIIRRAEATWRRTVSASAEKQRVVWSFEVVHCAGTLTGTAVEPEDLVALELARLETNLSGLRHDVADALARTRGVLLFPSSSYPLKGPVIAVASHEAEPKGLVDVSRRIAAAVGEPLVVLTHGIAYDAAGFATAIRRQHAVLAIAASNDSLIEEFLRRPRFLREMAVPLLLLKPEEKK
jgi:hypothetical protein